MASDLRERFEDAAVRDVPPLDVNALLKRHHRAQRRRFAAGVVSTILVLGAVTSLVLQLRPPTGAPVIGGPGPVRSPQEQPTDTVTSDSSGVPRGALLADGWESELVVVTFRSQPRNGNIYVMRPDGSQRRTIVTRPMDDGEAQVSPDGRRVVFTSQDDATRNLYVVNVDGNGLRQLTNDVENDHAPSWTPDGESIVFFRRFSEENRSRIWRIDADGTGLEILIDDGNTTNPAVSPDGTTIVYSRFDERPDEPNGFTVDLWVANIDGTGARRLVETPGLKDWGPEWSPDGQRLVFYATDDESRSDHDVYVIDADGTDLTQLTDSPTGDWSPVWSPDGTRILFTGQRDGSSRELLVMQADGSDLHRLTNDAGEYGSPFWVTRATY